MRFPEFEGEWKETIIGDVADVIGGGTPDTTVSSYWDGDIAWFTPTEIGHNKYVRKSKRTISEKGLCNSSAKLLPLGAILLTTRATIGETSITLNACTTNQGFQSLISKSNIDNEFLYYLIGTKKKDLFEKACGSTFMEISANEVRKIRIKAPTKQEQVRIAKFLAILDERIETQIGAIGKIESLITGITSKVSHSNNVKKMYLKDLLMERTERNVGHHEVYSVSVSEGVVNQVEYLGRSFAAAETSHYSVARYGDIIYTKSPTGSFPYGIVKRSAIPDPVAVSPLYGVYQPINENIGIYLHQYFCSTINAHNYLHRLIQKGAKNTINITNQRFLENTVPIPDEVTLEKYVKVIDSLTQKLKNEKCLLESYRRQKFYLLKNMFV